MKFNIKETIESCQICQDLQFKEELANNDRLPIEIFHKAGKTFEDHLFTHFEGVKN